MAKLTRSFRNVLSELVSRHGAYVAQNRLPDGNGMAGRASGAKLRAMKEAGLVEYGKSPSASFYGYRITDAGRAALQSSEAQS